MTLFPLAAGNRWIYSYTHSEEGNVEVELEGPAQQDLGPFGTLLAWPLRNPIHDDAFVVPGENGLRIIEVTWVGPIGRRTLTIESDYRWRGEPTWEFDYAGGCVVTRVTVVRRGLERLTVAAGIFDCLRFDFSDGRDRDESHWLCDGVGLVRRVERHAGEESRLELVEARLV